MPAPRPAHLLCALALAGLAACGGGGGGGGGDAGGDAGADTGGATGCDCCGTWVEVPGGGSCSTGVCDPWCRPAPPDAGADGGVDAGPACRRECVAGPPWRCDACLPTALQEIGAAVADGRIHVLGGFESAFSIGGGLLRYDPAADTWTEGPSLPDARHHVGFAAVGGDLYAVGGMRDLSFEPLARSWVLRAGASVWEEVAPLPRPRAAMAIGAIGGKLYVAAGQSDADGASPLENARPVLVYDPDADAWSEGAPIPTAREHVASVVHGGELWVLGGRPLAVDEPMTTVEVYDPAADAWRAGPSLRTPHGGAAAAVWGGVVYVSGGEQARTAEAPDGALDVVEALDLAGGADAWVPAAPLPTRRHGHAMAALDGRVYAIGGADVTLFGAVDVVESFAP